MLEVDEIYVTPDDELILDARATTPDHVVYRDFVNETVMLNLQTGTYHGLNRIAGLMLTALESTPTVRAAAARLIKENDWDAETVERDLIGLCRTLAESGLIELSPPASAEGAA